MFPRKKSRKLLEEVLPLNIIREVEKWPALYSKGCPEWSNAHFRKKMWYEIGKSLFSDWNDYSHEDKEKKVADLTKKWRNLRDTFKKNYDLEKKAANGDTTPGKKYVYFKYMSFLVPHITQEESDHAETPEERKTHLKRWNTEGTSASDSLNINNTTDQSNKLSRLPPRKRRKLFGKTKALINNKDLSTLYKLGAEDYIDENKHFLMSLIPYFNKMSDDERLTAKVEILKVIKEVRRGSSCDASIAIEVAAVDALNCQNEMDHLANTVKEEMFHSESSCALQQINFVESDDDTD